MFGKFLSVILIVKLMYLGSNGQGQQTNMMFENFLQQYGRNMATDKAGLPVMYNMFTKVLQWAKNNPSALQPSTGQTTSIRKQAGSKTPTPAGGVPVTMTPGVNFQAMRKTIQQINANSNPNNFQKKMQGKSMNRNKFSNPFSSFPWMAAASQPNRNVPNTQQGPQNISPSTLLNKNTFDMSSLINMPKGSNFPPQGANLGQGGSQPTPSNMNSFIKMAQTFMQQSKQVNGGSSGATTQSMKKNPPTFPYPPRPNTMTPTSNAGNPTGANGASSVTGNSLGLVNMFAQLMKKNGQTAGSQPSTATTNIPPNMPATSRTPLTGLGGSFPAVTSAPILPDFTSMMNTMLPLKYFVHDIGPAGLVRESERMEFIPPSIRYIQREGSRGETSVYVDKTAMGTGIFALVGATKCYVGMNNEALNQPFITAIDAVAAKARKMLFQGGFVQQNQQTVIAMEVPMLRSMNLNLNHISFGIAHECDGRQIVLIKPMGTSAFMPPSMMRNCYKISAGQYCIMPDPLTQAAQA